MISSHMVRNSSPDVRAFISLLMLAISETMGVYPCELVTRRKYRPVPEAREVFRQIARRHLRRRLVEVRQGQLARREYRLFFQGDGEPIGNPACGFLLNQDHSAGIVARPANADRVAQVEGLVMQAWPTVRDGRVIEALAETERGKPCETSSKS